MAESQFKCLCTGFESNSYAAEFASAGTGAGVTIQNTVVLSGTYTAKLNYTGAINSTWQYAQPEGPEYWVGSECVQSGYFKLRISGTPVKQIQVGVGIQFGALAFGMDTSRHLLMYHAGNSATGSTALTAGVTYEVSFVVAANDKVYVRINGVDEMNVTWADPHSSTLGISGGLDNSAKGATGYGIDWYIDDLVLLYTNKAGVQTPWITPQVVTNLLPGAEGVYADSTPTGTAHPNAHTNVDDYNGTADYNRLGSNAAVKRDTYKQNATFVPTGTFNGFTVHAKLLANNSPSAVAPLLIRDNAVDITSGRAAVSTELTKCLGYYKYRPSDDTVALTEAMLENVSGNNIEYGLYVPVQSGGTMTYDIISQWVTIVDGNAYTDVAYTAPPATGRRRFAGTVI